MYGIKTKKVGILLQPILKTESNSNPVGAGISVADTNWDNPSAGTQTFHPMIVDASSIKVSDVLNYGEIPNATGDASVFQSKDRVMVSNKSVFPKVSMDIYPDALTFSIISLLASQFATQGASTNYNKTVTPRNELIDFKSGDGILGTIQGIDSAGYGFILENAVVDSLTINISNSVGNVVENVYKLSVVFAGRKITRATTTSKLFATLSGNGAIYYGSVNDSKTIIESINFNSGDLVITNPCWKNLTITMNNNYEAFCMGPDGYLQGFTRNNPTISSKIDIPYNDSTKTILNRTGNGENYSFSIAKYGLGTTDPLYMKISSLYNLATEDPESVDGSKMGISLTGNVLNTAGAGFSIVNADGVDYLDKVFDTSQTN